MFQVTWCIMGPDDINQPLTSTHDIGVSATSTDALITFGVLYWADGQTGVNSLSLVIQPYSPGQWHVERHYYIRICSIRTNSSLMDEGQISPTAGTVTLIVCITLHFTVNFKVNNLFNVQYKSLAINEMVWCCLAGNRWRSMERQTESLDSVV